MPYASKAQARKFHAMEARGQISKKVVAEYDKATNFKKLPSKVHHSVRTEEDSYEMKPNKGKEQGAPELLTDVMHKVLAASSAPGKGSHETSHHKLGGARAKIDTGDPSEQMSKPQQLETP